MNRTELINYLIKKNNYKTYLEIGCRSNENFNAVDIKNKTGVDPEQGGTHRMKSNTYFFVNKLFWNKKKFDIIFIDGLHYSKQVFKDIKNSLRVLNPGGTIVLHDCNPQNEDEAAYPHKGTWIWNGDVWKAFVRYRQERKLDMVTGDFDNGCGIIRLKTNTDLIKINRHYTNLSWDDLQNNRNKWLRLMDVDELRAWLDE